VTWLKIDDRMPEHRKVRRLSHAAFRLHVTLLCLCARDVNDGQVTRDDVDDALDARPFRDDDGDALLAELVAAGLLDVDGDGWRVHDYLDHNPSRADVEAQREREREKKRAQRARGYASTGRDDSGRFAPLSPGPSPALSLVVSPGDTRGDTRGDAPGDTLGESPGESRGVSPATRPVPSRPRETPNGVSPAAPAARDAEHDLEAVEDTTDTLLDVEVPETPKRGRRKPERPLPASWAPSDAHRELAAELHVDVEAQAVRFRDHAESNDRRQRDWDAAFRTWLRNAPRFAVVATPGRAGGDRLVMGRPLSSYTAEQRRDMELNPWKYQ
jgi:hypothetical protein